MRVETKNVYTFDELPEETQDKIIENFQNSDYPLADYDCVLEDATEIAELFGLDIRNTLKTRMDKTTFYAPTIYWSGFWSQGDGACFEGSYAYKKGGLKAVMDYAGRDENLHQIVKGFQDLQRRHFYRLSASIKHRGHYHHERSMTIDVDFESCPSADHNTEEELKDLFADYACWIYRRLEAEYEASISKESIMAMIECNDFEFYEDGTIA